MVNSFNVTILGSSSALPTSQRNTTAQMINHAERFFLVDCGEGTQIQLRRFQIRFFRIDNIFISHMHGDHFFGLPGLLNTFNLLGRKKDLHLYGPPKLKIFIEAIESFALHHLSYKIVFHPLTFEDKTLIYENKFLSVYSFPVSHKIPTCGFSFEEKKMPRNILKDAIEKYQIPIKDIKAIKDGSDFKTEDGTIIPNDEITIDSPEPRKYAFCTDTQYDENVVSYIKHVNVLYHEATFQNDMAEHAAETQHSTAGDAGKIANKAGAKKLLLGHFSSRYKDFKQFIADANEEFSNEIVTVEDGMKIEIS